MNIPFCVLKNQTSISSKSYEYHQSLCKKLFKAFKNINSVNLCIQYSKDEILNWLFNQNFKNRLKICSIYNDWFTKILFQLLTYYSYDNYVGFTPRECYEDLYKFLFPKFEEENFDYEKIKNNENQTNMEINFDTFFEGKSIHYNDRKTLHIQNKEKTFLKELRFISLNKLNDTLTLSFDLLNSKKKLEEYFDIFSDNKIFSDNVMPFKAKRNSNILNFTLPKWEINQDFLTISQLVTIFFEQIISINYQIFIFIVCQRGCMI